VAKPSTPLHKDAEAVQQLKTVCALLLCTGSQYLLGLPLLDVSQTIVTDRRQM
jgi:hypothetical protein